MLGRGTTDVLERRVAALKAENAGMRELLDSQASRLEELERRVATLEGDERQPGSAAALDAGRRSSCECGDDQGQGPDRE